MLTSYGLTRIDSSDHELDILLVYSMIEITIFQKIGSCIPILGNASPLLSLLCPSHSKPVQGNAWDHPRAHWLVLGEEKTTAWGRESICTGYASCKFRLVVLLARGSEIMVSIFSMRERFFFSKDHMLGSLQSSNLLELFNIVVEPFDNTSTQQEFMILSY